MVLRVLRQPHWHHRAAQNGWTEVIEIGERLPQHHTVVHAGRHHDLGMKFDPVLSKLTQLRYDFRSCRVAQKVPAYDGICRVDRYIQWRQAVLDNPADVRSLEVGQGRKVSIPKGKPVVIVADVQDLPQPIR
jgi:hypothetical protein